MMSDDFQYEWQARLEMLREQWVDLPFVLTLTVKAVDGSDLVTANGHVPLLL